MPCPTCSHTIARVTDTIAHCERCGTLVVERGRQTSWQDVYVPKLVKRCRTFADEMLGPPDGGSGVLRTVWDYRGIDECIRTEEERRRS